MNLFKPFKKPIEKFKNKSPSPFSRESLERSRKKELEKRFYKTFSTLVDWNYPKGVGNYNNFYNSSQVIMRMYYFGNEYPLKEYLEMRKKDPEVFLHLLNFALKTYKRFNSLTKKMNAKTPEEVRKKNDEFQHLKKLFSDFVFIYSNTESLLLTTRRALDFMESKYLSLNKLSTTLIVGSFLVLMFVANPQSFLINVCDALFVSSLAFKLAFKAKLRGISSMRNFLNKDLAPIIYSNPEDYL